VREGQAAVARRRGRDADRWAVRPDGRQSSAAALLRGPGLLVCSRSPSGQRHYDEAHVERVRLVRAFLAAGMSSSTIAEMVPCMAEPSRGRAQRALALVNRERTRLSSDVGSLVAAVAVLDDLITDDEEYLDARGAP
jgi:DNA-binding transcriptional MerR regulator